MDAILGWLPNSQYTLYALAVVLWGLPFALCYLIASIHPSGYGPEWAWVFAPALAAVVWSAFCLFFTWAVLTDPDNVV